MLPPTNAIANFFDATDWLDNTIKILKQNTDREIDVREKPYNPTIEIDHVGATVKVDKPTVHKGNINWNDYHATVTYNSNTMIASLTNGVPVFCDPENSAAAPISETDFSKIETPKSEEIAGIDGATRSTTIPHRSVTIKTVDKIIFLLDTFFKEGVGLCMRYL